MYPKKTTSVLYTITPRVKILVFHIIAFATCLFQKNYLCSFRERLAIPSND